MPRTSQEDPIKVNQFIVEMGGSRTGFKECSGLQVEIEVTEYREGGDNTTTRKSPGLAKFPNITLKRGQGLDEGKNDFIDWVKQVFDLNSKGKSVSDYRRDIDIVQYDRAGEEAYRWRVVECWPCGFKPMGDLQGQSSDDSIAELILANEGFDLV